ncbi:MAG: multifunctional oxoglutarate decarboxylase/oxoglutarate dehydrogenase thiamine pyrophosphate-binding subunit/dihydrolipoyllysine-residue succinyltransferase subunit [Frankiaceae bacterium]
MTTQSDPLAGFGPNEWLVHEIYQQYLADPDSVDRAWWDFFADYQPVEGPSPAGDGQAAPAEAAAPPAEAEAPQAAAAPPAPAAPAPAPAAASAPVPLPEGAQTRPLRGVAARIVANMEQSLELPTATSVRAVPAKLLIDNRTVINNHLRRSRGGKVSFTHLIGYALVKALADFPEMNNAFAEVDGKPSLVLPDHVNLGLAIDLQKDDGSRTLVVPSIKAAETMDFVRFWQAYEDIVRRARANKLTLDDYAGTTISLTNPGTIGTVHSVPRLMPGQGTIVGVGALDLPAEFQGASPQTMAQLGVSKILTLTSTYDHRIIQGAVSGDFLRRIHQLLLGDEFYDEVFRSLRIPYEPVRWVPDISTSREDQVGKQARVIELIHAYRVRGHLMADTNPLEFELRRHPDLDVVNHGLTLWDLDREFATGGFAGAQRLPLRDILGVLRDSYCRTVGIEYMHIQDPAQRTWLQDRVERHEPKPDRDDQLRILGKLNQAEAFETFLQTKYVGQKRFSLEGGESLIPLLDALLSEAAREGLDEVCIGMPHRGRLNVLANIVGKGYAAIFREFEGNIDPRTAHGSGDVKYHLGAEGTFTSDDGEQVRVYLASNPSHLEAVDPVLEGVVRAKQDVLDRGPEGFSVLPVLMHGDAAFAGQGVVAETLNLSQLRGYRTGGTVHIVVNNQVGYTTAPTAGRSSVYATDVARMVQAPIFHVNGDDPEAVVRVAKLAYEFRQAFHKDVVVDMLCYRRRGHSEVDEPSFTQPQMYDLIDAKRSVRKLYTESLIGRGDISLDEAEKALRHYQEQLEKVFVETRDANGHRPVQQAGPADRTGRTDDLADERSDGPVDTAVSAEAVKLIANSQVELPESFTVHPRLLPQLQKRAAMVDDGSLDWAMGEMLAFGSLLLQGVPVRLSGQDSRRGTFGHRHAVLIDRETGAEYTPLKHLAPDQAPFYVYDSLLSEFAAMGFEYGYSVARPEALVMWEAQFGDFANGAQSIVDEFISSGEAKWGQRSRVVLLLPHGYEGQGPDHSSARMERYLQMCADGNMTVALPSTPGNYFHLLRRQSLGPVARPLVVFTPKSILRLKAATSPLDELTGGRFRPVIDDRVESPESIRRVVLCSGKAYYDLLAARRKRGAEGVALVRVEQLYPLPVEEIAATVQRYPGASDVAWVQEEPANMGAWTHVALNLPLHLGDRKLRRISRPAGASPSAGSATVHEAEQAALIDAALTL